MSVGEETALQALLDSFPKLTTTQPPWTINVSQACETPSFYGLTCSDGPDPHILKLYESIFYVLPPPFLKLVRIACQSLDFSQF